MTETEDMEKIKTPEEFEQILDDENFNAKRKRASKPFTLSMSLPEHITNVDSDRRHHFGLYKEHLEKFIEKKKEIDSYYEYLKKVSKENYEKCYGKSETQFREFYGISLLMLKHLHCAEILTVSLQTNAVRFAYKTLNKDYKTNISELFKEEFREKIPMLAQLLLLAEQIGEMKNVEKKLEAYKQATGAEEER